MKTKIIIGIILSLTVFCKNTFPYGVATREEVAKYGASIAAGRNHTCALDYLGVKCWGDNEDGQSNVPYLKNVQQVAVGYDHSCAIDDSGVKCWGDNSEGQTDVPPLSHPTQVAAGGAHTCVIDDSRVKCWGMNSDGQTTVPPLKNPQWIAAGKWFTCAIDEIGAKCWGSRSEVVPLHHPRQIVAGSDHFCVLNDWGVKCEGYGRRGETEVPALQNPKLIAAGDRTTCAIDDTGAKCWGYSTEMPPLDHPKMIAVGHNHHCALDDSGILCWGENRYGQTVLPEGVNAGISILTSKFTSEPAKYLENISQHFPRIKAGFLQKSAALTESIVISESATPSVPYRQSLQLLALYELTLPLMEETTSSLVQDKVLPKFKRDISKLRTQMGIFSVNEIDLIPKTASIALSLSSVALDASKTYLVQQSERQELEEMVQELGMASAKLQGKNKMWKEDAQVILKIYLSHHALLESLIESEKTRAFGMVLTKAQNYFEAQ